MSRFRRENAWMRGGFLLLVLLVAVASVVAPGLVRAECRCACVDGTVKAVCQSAAELPPICGAGLCGVAPPAIRPVGPRAVPPVGARTCSQHQVQNSITGRYEWQTLCR